MPLNLPNTDAPWRALHTHSIAAGGLPIPRCTGYNRLDARIRRTPFRPNADAPIPQTLQDLVNVSEGGWADNTWFETRWTGGEGERVRALTLGAIADIEALDQGDWIGPEPITLVLSAAGPPRPIAFPNVAMVVAPLQAPPFLTLAATIACRLGPYPLNVPADSRAASLQQLLIGATLWSRRPGSEALLEAGLSSFTDALCPTARHQSRFGTFFDAITAGLERPPGEIVRIRDGLLSRRADRLHRAFLRGFFLPDHWPLPSWADETPNPEA